MDLKGNGTQDKVIFTHPKNQIDQMNHSSKKDKNNQKNGKFAKLEVVIISTDGEPYTKTIQVPKEVVG